MSHVKIVGLAVAFVLSSGLAMADSCKVVSQPLLMSSNSSADVQAVVTTESCTHNYATTRTTVTDTIIASKPKHGTLEVVSVNGATYTPKKGYKGVDTYSIKFCGSYLGEKGCATYNYTTTVQ